MNDVEINQHNMTDYYNSKNKQRQQEDSAKIFLFAIIGLIITVLLITFS